MTDEFTTVHHIRKFEITDAWIDEAAEIPPEVLERAAAQMRARSDAIAWAILTAPAFKPRPIKYEPARRWRLPFGPLRDLT